MERLDALAVDGYLWLISFVPLGSWNAQPGPHMASALLAGQRLQAGDIGFLVFVSLPGVLFWFAHRRRSFLFAIAALFFDAFWMLMQVQSWWMPYITGNAKPWQIEYAHGSTTKVLPSFGTHVAPDAMHLMISVLLVACMATGMIGLRQLRRHRVYPVPLDADRPGPFSVYNRRSSLLDRRFVSPDPYLQLRELPSCRKVLNRRSEPELLHLVINMVGLLQICGRKVPDIGVIRPGCDKLDARGGEAYLA